MGNEINLLFSRVQKKLVKVHQLVRAESISCASIPILCYFLNNTTTMLAVHMVPKMMIIFLLYLICGNISKL